MGDHLLGPNFVQNESSQSSQIYLSPEKLRKMFTFQSCKFLNDKIDQNTNSTWFNSQEKPAQRHVEDLSFPLLSSTRMQWKYISLN